MKIIFFLIGSMVSLFAQESSVQKNAFLYGGLFVIALVIGYIVMRKSSSASKEKTEENEDNVTSSSASKTNFEVLEKYRIEMRKIKIENQPFRLSGLLHILTNKLSEALKTNKHTIYYDVNNDVGRYIMGDNDYIEQVLEILLKDILSLSTNSEISLKISNIKNKSLQFEVINKKGFMSKDLVTNYIESERTLSSMSESLLAFIKAKKIAAAMKGSLTLKSSRLFGTQYTFEIPYFEDKDNRSKQEELKKVLKGKRALFIAKDKHDSKRAQYIFSTFGILIEDMKLSDFEESKPDLSPYHMVILRSEDITAGHLSFFKKIHKDKQSDFKMIVVHELFESEEKIAISKDIAHAELYNPTIIGDVEEILYQMFILKSNAVKGINNMEIFDPETFTVKSNIKVTQEHFEKFKGAHIAVVEDSKVDQRIMRNLLKIDEITVFCLNNGQEMLDLLKTEEIDLIFSDINMPVMDGLTMTKEIRKVREWDKIPIISISSMAFVHEVKEMQRAGMNASISKPIIAEEVYQALKRFLVISPKLKERRSQPQKISYQYNKNILNIDKGIDEAGGQQQYREILIETMEILEGTPEYLGTMIKREEYHALSEFAKSSLDLYENIHAPEMVKMFQELIDYLSIKQRTYVMEYIFIYKKNWRQFVAEAENYLEDTKA